MGASLHLGCEISGKKRDNKALLEKQPKIVVKLFITSALPFGAIPIFHGLLLIFVRLLFTELFAGF